jgi:heme A synthase
MSMLFSAHSGLRYLVLLVGVAALAYFAYAAVSAKGNERTSRVLGASFSGLLDLQILLGIGMVVLGLFYSQLIGHMFMMIAAAVVSHAAMVMAKNAEPEQRRSWMRFAGVAVALLLIVGGIMAIGRSVFGSGVPSVGG